MLAKLHILTGSMNAALRAHSHVLVLLPDAGAVAGGGEPQNVLRALLLFANSPRV